MKTIFFFLLVTLFACSKNKDNHIKITVLSKYFVNNILVSEFIYSADKKIIRENSYSDQSGKLESYSEFDYDPGGVLKEERHFNALHKMSSKANYYYHADGRLDKQDYMDMDGSDSGKVVTRIKYAFDLSGRIGKQSWIDPENGDLYYYRQFSFYDNNNMRLLELINVSGGVSELDYKIEYTPAGSAIPPSLLQHKAYPIDFRMFDMASDERHYYKYNAANLVTAETAYLFADKTFDTKGYLLQQKRTFKQIKPAAADKVTHLRYEYIQL